MVLLGEWFHVHRRDLPWRRTRDPYAIWLSEIMLQQTRVSTALEYYDAFLARFPSVTSLAGASVDEVLGAWSGLGYYKRARSLHVGAKEIVERYGGALPSGAAELETVTGIGPYTAGAIASLAFGEATPLVDGNVARVFARLFALDVDVRAPRSQRTLWTLASVLLDRRSPGHHNEALMELGATVCTKAAPRCDHCPLRSVCLAFAKQRVDQLPISGKRPRAKVVELVALLARRDGRVLMAQRSGEGLFASMWEPPMIELGPGDRADEVLSSRMGVAPTEVREGPAVVRLLSHRRMKIRTMHGVLRVVPPPFAPYVRFDWVMEAELGQLAISTMARKVLDSNAPAKGNVSPCG